MRISTTRCEPRRRGFFFNTGQVCSAGSRNLARRDVYDEVVERLAARAKAVKVGDPAARETSMGPLISAAQMKTVLGYVETGRSEGASLVTAACGWASAASSSSRAVFANVEHEMRISQEEIFGPVASVIRFNDEADAIRIANGPV